MGFENVKRRRVDLEISRELQQKWKHRKHIQSKYQLSLYE